MTHDARTVWRSWRFAAAAVGVAAIGWLGAPGVPAQSPPAGSPTFEVASVRPNTSGDGRVMIGLQPGGRYTATNVPLRLLIRNAYQVQDFQLVDAPGWISSERFDIVAKGEGDPAPTSPGTAGPFQLMVRALLEERFKLAVHTETREMAIYALVTARDDRALGPGLRPAAVDCQAQFAAARGRRGGPPPFPAPGEPIACGMRIGPGRMEGGGFPLSQLATTLSQFVERIVLDRTGLDGNFDLTLTWTPDQIQGLGGPPPPGAPAFPPIDPNGPSVFTALQEQLGLKLESERGPVDVLVIDHVERPTPD
jgi:uncharacterized protein (TIGR03435 family)